MRVIYSKQDKTLLLLKSYFGQDMYGGPVQRFFFLKKRVVYELGSHFNQIRFKEIAV